MTLNSTNPGATVNAKDSKLAPFAISINRLAEMNGNVEVRSILVPPIAFTKTVVTSGLNVMSNYSAQLFNGAFLSVIVSFLSTIYLFSFFLFFVSISLLSFMYCFVLLIVDV